jgi:hypothetical protein
VRPLPPPTSTHPGTPERVEVYRVRFAAGLALYSPLDRRGDTGPLVPARLACDYHARAVKAGEARKSPILDDPPRYAGLPLGVCRRCGVRRPVYGPGARFPGVCVPCVMRGRG